MFTIFFEMALSEQMNAKLLVIKSKLGRSRMSLVREAIDNYIRFYENRNGVINLEETECQKEQNYCP